MSKSPHRCLYGAVSAGNGWSEPPSMGHYVVPSNILGQLCRALRPSLGNSCFHDCLAFPGVYPAGRRRHPCAQRMLTAYQPTLLCGAHLPQQQRAQRGTWPEPGCLDWPGLKREPEVGEEEGYQPNCVLIWEGSTAQERHRDYRRGNLSSENLGQDHLCSTHLPFPLHQAPQGSW